MILQSLGLETENSFPEWMPCLTYTVLATFSACGEVNDVICVGRCLGGFAMCDFAFYLLGFVAQWAS